MHTYFENKEHGFLLLLLLLSLLLLLFLFILLPLFCIPSLPPSTLLLSPVFYFWISGHSFIFFAFLFSSPQLLLLHFLH